MESIKRRVVRIVRSLYIKLYRNWGRRQRPIGDDVEDRFQPYEGQSCGGAERHVLCALRWWK